MRSLRTFPQFPELGRSGWFQMWCSDAPGDSPALSPVFLVVMEQSSWIFIWFMYNPHPKLTVLGLLSSILGPMIWITEEACGLIQVGGAGTCYWIFNRLSPVQLACSSPNLLFLLMQMYSDEWSLLAVQILRGDVILDLQNRGTFPLITISCFPQCGVSLCALELMIILPSWSYPTHESVLWTGLGVNSWWPLAGSMVFTSNLVL